MRRGDFVKGVESRRIHSKPNRNILEVTRKQSILQILPDADFCFSVLEDVNVLASVFGP